MKKKLNFKFLFCFVFLLVFLGIFYFKYSLIVSPDGSYYYSYTKIFDGIVPFKMWDIMRGFSFPLVIFIFKHLFGDDSTGMLIGFFIFYLILVVVGAIILNKCLKKYHPNNNFILWLLYVLLIMFNPLSIGYSHTLLTEAITPSIIMITLYLCLKWKDILWNKSKIKVIVYTLIYSLIMVFMWFLKQPYMVIIFSLLFSSSVLSSISFKSWKIFIEKILCCVTTVIFLFISIFVWNKVLVLNNVKVNNSVSSSNYLANGIILGINYHFNEVIDQDVCDIDFIKSSKLSEKNKNKIISLSVHDDNWCDKIRIFNIMKSGKTIGQDAIIFEKDSISVGDSLKYLIKNFVKHPLLVIHGYYKNYMTTIDFYPYTVLPNMSYVAGSKFDINVAHENSSLAFVTYTNVPLCWWQYYDTPKERLESDEVKSMKSYEGWQNFDLEEQSFMLDNIKPIYLMIFKISLLLVLPFAIYCFIKYLKNRKNIIYYLTTVIFASSFIHILFHAVMGSIIDRYAYVVMPISLLGYILLFIPKRRKEVMKKNRQIPFNKNGKVLFVIPAYNEEKHIEKVINDIHKNMPKADIVVTNDYSKDNTKEIVEKLNVPCLNVPFNMGYAMAVQTGIKYAYKNNYDYAILFDADGQHLASEAKKLLKKMEETNANIIIGSRFIEKTDYKHPFFRKIGTKVFQIIIKLFCHKKITDPTSGFQLIDKSVIERYAKIGKYPEFPDANLIIEMLISGYEIEEVSVKMKLNDEGKSMHGGIIKPIKYMINVTYSIIFILIKGKSNRED